MVGVHVKKKPHLRRPHIPRIHGNRKTSPRSNGSTWSYQKTLHCTRPHHLLSLSLSLENISINGRPELTLPSSFLLFPIRPNKRQKENLRSGTPIVTLLVQNPNIYVSVHFVFRFSIVDFDVVFFDFAYLSTQKKKEEEGRACF